MRGTGDRVRSRDVGNISVVVAVQVTAESLPRGCGRSQVRGARRAERKKDMDERIFVTKRGYLRPALLHTLATSHSPSTLATKTMHPPLLKRCPPSLSVSPSSSRVNWTPVVF
jgi:hypothetical protein